MDYISQLDKVTIPFISSVNRIKSTPTTSDFSSSFLTSKTIGSSTGSHTLTTSSTSTDNIIICLFRLYKSLVNGLCRWLYPRQRRRNHLSRILRRGLPSRPRCRARYQQDHQVHFSGMHGCLRLLQHPKKSPRRPGMPCDNLRCESNFVDCSVQCELLPQRRTWYGTRIGELYFECY